MPENSESPAGTRLSLREALEFAATQQRAGRANEAEAVYRRILEVRPLDPNANHLLAVIAMQRGEVGESLRLFDTAIEHGGGTMPEVWSNYGCALKDDGRLADAEHAFEQALELDPDHAAALANLGGLLMEDGRVAAAVAAFRRCVATQPALARGWLDLGLALQADNQVADAVEALNKACSLEPGYIPARNALALALAECGRFDEAQAHLEEALAIEPGNRESAANLAVIAENAGRLDDAIGRYDALIAAHPGDIELIWNRGLVHLKKGDYARGLSVYAMHDALPGVRRRKPPPGRRWSGEDLAGKRVFVMMEQGLGDMMQFVRFVPALKEAGATVVLESYRALERLFRAIPHADEVRSFDDYPAGCDFHVPLMSVPHNLGTTLDDLPGPVPYLVSASGPAPEVRSGDDDALKVGIVWSSNPAARNARRKSCMLEDLAPLAAVNGVRLYSLQVGEDAAQLADVPFAGGIVDLGSKLDDLADTAAVIAALDLVISIDTVVAHLAGALGARVWPLLPFVPDWRWMLARDDSPWYPTMQLFRQPAPGDWRTPVAEIVEGLADMCAERTN